MLYDRNETKGTLPPQEKHNLKEQVGPIVYVYNCNRNDTTGYSPFYLMYGRLPRLPIDILLGIREDVEHESLEYETYIGKLRDRLSDAYKLAASCVSNQLERQKQAYDRKKTLSNATLESGDRVLVKQVGFQGPHKLANRWSDEVYLFVDKPNFDIPVYRVQFESLTGPIRTLHRNMLLPVGQIDFSIPQEPSPSRKGTSRKEVVAHETREEEEESQDIWDESEEDVPLVFVDHDNLPQIDTIGPTDLAEIPSVTELVPAVEPVVPEGNIPAVDAPTVPIASPERGPGQTDGDAPADLGEAEPPDLVFNEPPEPRRSGRERRPPAWFTSGEFVTSKASKVFEVFV